jgi:hypothetical protein
MRLHNQQKRRKLLKNDFYIKRCISVLKTMDITRDEKIKAAEVFNTPNYRETFICFNDDEPEVALL